MAIARSEKGEKLYRQRDRKMINKKEINGYYLHGKKKGL